MLEVLEQTLHARANEWVFFRELRVGTGQRQHELQRLDAFAMNCLPYLGMKRVCYELKMSRADFLSEVKRPLKRRIGMRFSNEFYFVTPPGLLKVQEIPTECGLIEIGSLAEDEKPALGDSALDFVHVHPETRCSCKVTVPAPWRDTPGPTWQFAAAMLRNCQRALAEKPPTPPKQQKLELL